jgi:long-chain acyl-CoA synthetase
MRGGLDPVDLVDYHGIVAPEKPAVIAGDAIVTFGMLRGAVHTLKQRLASFDLAPGSVVVVWVSAPARHVALNLALAALGLVCAPVGSKAGLELIDKPGLILAETGADPGRDAVEVGDDWFAGSPPEAQASRRHVADDALMRIGSSSGSTGSPKPMLYPRWLYNAHVAAPAAGYEIAGPWSRMLSMMDITSSWGWFATLAVLSSGRTICFAASSQDTLRLISVYSCDCMIASVFQLRALVETQRQHFVPVPSLRGIIMGGSSIPEELVHGIQATLTQRVVLGYGSTEVGLSAMEIVSEQPWQDGATGFVTPWTDIEAVDQSHQPMPIGREGELRLRLRDGLNTGEWFYSGDRGSVSPAGRLTITGRTSDLINIGGVKLAPEMFEQVLLSFPGVRDAGVVGVRGRGGLESVAAAVVGNDPIDFGALERHCAQRNELAVPSRFVQVAAIPRGLTGKIARPTLREMLGE